MKKWKLLIVVGLFLGWAKGAAGDDTFLKALQDTLAKLGNPWIADKTSVSDLPLEAKRQIANLRIPEKRGCVKNI